MTTSSHSLLDATRVLIDQSECIVSLVEPGNKTKNKRALTLLCAANVKNAIEQAKEAIGDAYKVPPELLRQLVIAYPDHEVEQYADFVHQCASFHESPWPSDAERWMSVDPADGSVYAGDYYVRLERKFRAWLTQNGRFMASWRQVGERLVEDPTEIINAGGKPGDVVVEVVIEHNRWLAEFGAYLSQIKELIRGAVAEAMSDADDRPGIRVGDLATLTAGRIEKAMLGETERWPTWEKLKGYGISRFDEPKPLDEYRDSHFKRAARRARKGIFRTLGGRWSIEDEILFADNRRGTSPAVTTMSEVKHETSSPRVVREPDNYLV